MNAMNFTFSKRRGAPQLRAPSSDATKLEDQTKKTEASPSENGSIQEPPIDPDVAVTQVVEDPPQETVTDEIEDFGTLVDARQDHPAIDALLSSLQTLKVFVTREGVVYYVDVPRRRRALDQVIQLVQQEIGHAIAKPISLMAYSKLRSRAVRTQHESVSHNDLVEMVLHDAIERKSSDVYIAIHTNRTQIHFRTHGVRYLHSEISRKDGLEMARSLWSLARDGQFDENAPTDSAFSFGGFRVRANSMKDVRGNSIVLRLRDPRFLPPLAELGYSLPQQRKIDELQWSPGGLAVISGETNSGKSTTLTSLMAGMPETEMIIEIADPIEIEFDHVTHVGFDHYGEDADVLFRAMLGALVRQNPDTLFIGEVRDLQSAKAAIDMSLQGKRVWGTVHSHSCLTTISRLEHLGIDVNLLAQPGFLNGVINQSLVPIVCEKCSTPKLDDDVLTSRLRHKYQSDSLRFHNPDGCSECTRGISGQTVAAEVMFFPRDPAHPSRQFIRDHDLSSLAKCMHEEGMLSKAAHAVSKIQQGLLDPILTEEIIGRIGTRDALPDEIVLQSNPMPLRTSDLAVD